MAEHSSCRDTLEASFRARGIDAHVTAIPPIVPSAYEPLNLTCPHGVAYYAEPTSEQIARWAADGVA
jgi:hypothetical protein